MADNQIETIETREVGRPCKYETHVEPYLDKIYQWLKDGYTDYSIAEQLGIHQNTWMRYKDNYSILGDLYTRARTSRNCLVMNSMYGKAVGIEKSVPKAFKIKEVTYDDKGKKSSEIERLEYAKEYIYVPPDVNAADLFLRNNDPEYKSAKSTQIGDIMVNNFQLGDWEAKRQEYLQEIKKLETIGTSDYKVIDGDTD